MSRATWLRHSMRTSTVLAGVMVVSNVSIASGQEAWEAIAAARNEGSVIVYGSAAPATMARLKGCFDQTYPDIGMAFVFGTSGQMSSRIAQERQSGADGGDVWITTEFGWFADRSAEGALLKPSGPALESWPADYLLNGDSVFGGLEPYVISYNTELLSTPPVGYQDFLQDEYRGRVGVSEFTATIVVAFYDWLNESFDGYLDALAAQNPRTYTSSTAIVQAVGSGEIAASSYGILSAVTPVIATGAPVEYIVPEPAFGVPYVVGGFAWAKRPNSALVFLDFIMSDAGQQCWHGTGESASPKSGIEGSMDISKFYIWDYKAYPEDVVNEFKATWSPRFSSR